MNRQDQSIEQLYQTLTKAALTGKKGVLPKHHEQLDCLLHPEAYAPVWHRGACTCREEGASPCQKACLYQAIRRDETGKIIIDPKACTGCEACIDACQGEQLLASRDTPAMLLRMKEHTGPVYAMVEVAAFADILTMKEALEFDANIHTDRDFLLTSCCCPLWIAMIRKVYAQLMPHVPGSVSPMVVCGRVIKRLHKNAMTVFIGPCLAKKAEAREEDIKDAVDFVLTFREVEDLFAFAKIHPETLAEDDKEHSSAAGRIYARTGGVSQAVKASVKRLRPDDPVQVRAVQADGVPGCRALLEQLQNGEISANFLEGMGCVGGCVGGPRAIVDRQEGAENVERYAAEAPYQTPMENPYVVELLRRLGYETIEQLLSQSEMFERHFS